MTPEEFRDRVNGAINMIGGAFQEVHDAAVRARRGDEYDDVEQALLKEVLWLVSRLGTGELPRLDLDLVPQGAQDLMRAWDAERREP